MRVVMVSKALVAGAYQRKCELIAAHDDLELTVMVPPAWGPQSLERAHTAGYDLRVIPIRFGGKFHLHHYPTLARELAAARPDIVHIDEEPYNLATFLALRAVPSTPSPVRDGAKGGMKPKTLFFSWQNLMRTYPPPFRWMERSVLRRADGAIAGNHEAMEVLKAKGWQRAIDVLPQFGVDEDEFRPMVGAGLAPAPRPDAGASPAPTIGYVGRLVPEKGVDLLLDALAQLPDQVRLVIVGAGSMRDKLQQMAARLGIAARVEFRPAVPSVHMPSVYAGLDILVLPSRSRPNWKEQFGRVLIEAMACQVPVVGSTCGEIPNVIGDAGLVFQEGDARALQEQLQALLAKPEWRADLAQRGRARVLACYTMQRIADATADIYRRLHRGTERV